MGAWGGGGRVRLLTSVLIRCLILYTMNVSSSESRSSSWCSYLLVQEERGREQVKEKRSAGKRRGWAMGSKEGFGGFFYSSEGFGRRGVFGRARM